MKIEVRFRGLDVSPALREHTERRAHSHLRRFGDEVAKVLVRLSDINGPKGGIDKRCQVTVHGARCGVATLEQRSGDPYEAVDLAMTRIGQTIGRVLARVRSVGVAHRRRATDPLAR